MIICSSSKTFAIGKEHASGTGAGMSTKGLSELMLLSTGAGIEMGLRDVDALCSGKDIGVALLDSRLVNEARTIGSISSLLGFRLIHGLDVSALVLRFSSNFLLSSDSTVSLAILSRSRFSSSSLASTAAR